jgi:hypothetical protein
MTPPLRVGEESYRGIPQMKQTQTSSSGAWSVTVSEAGKEIATEQYATEAEAQGAVKRHREAGKTASAMPQKAPLQQQGA